MGQGAKKVWQVFCIVALLLLVQARLGGLVFAVEPVTLQKAVEVTLKTVDNVEIVGNYFSSSKKQLIIVINGLLQNKNHSSKGYFCTRLAEHFDVLNIDVRGHGVSGGDFSNGDKEIFDLQAAVNFGKAQGYSSIGIIGFSFGGYLSIKGAALSGGIISVASVGAPYGIMKEKYVKPEQKQNVGLYKLGEALIKMMFGSQTPDSACEENTILGPYLQTMRKPLLIFHGTQDRLVPFANAQSIQRAANEPNVLIPLEGANHAESLNDAKIDEILESLIPWFFATLR